MDLDIQNSEVSCWKLSFNEISLSENYPEFLIKFLQCAILQEN